MSAMIWMSGTSDSPGELDRLETASRTPSSTSTRFASATPRETSPRRAVGRRVSELSTQADRAHRRVGSPRRTGSARRARMPTRQRRRPVRHGHHRPGRGSKARLATSMHSVQRPVLPQELAQLLDAGCRGASDRRCPRARSRDVHQFDGLWAMSSLRNAAVAARGARVGHRARGERVVGELGMLVEAGQRETAIEVERVGVGVRRAGDVGPVDERRHRLRRRRRPRPSGLRGEGPGRGAQQRLSFSSASSILATASCIARRSPGRRSAYTDFAHQRMAEGVRSRAPVRADDVRVDRSSRAGEWSCDTGLAGQRRQQRLRRRRRRGRPCAAGAAGRDRAAMLRGRAGSRRGWVAGSRGRPSPRLPAPR